MIGTWAKVEGFGGGTGKAAHFFPRPPLGAVNRRAICERTPTLPFSCAKDRQHWAEVRDDRCVRCQGKIDQARRAEARG